MKRKPVLMRGLTILGIMSVVFLAGCGRTTAPAVNNQPSQPVSTNTVVVEAYGKLPLSFEANSGQADPRVKFLSRGNSYTFFLMSNEAVLSLRNGQENRVAVQLRLVGANSAARITGLDELPGKSNYFLGSDPSRWRTNVSTYARVRYRDIYPGVDLVYYGNQRQLEYDFIVAPGADPRVIQLAVAGADKLEVDADGDLVVRIPSGELRLRKPLIYQQGKGGRQEIVGGYALKDKQRIGFEVASYDVSKPLVIDPVLVYSTYLGGHDSDQGKAITVDANGNAYVTGVTSSFGFPTTPGAFQPFVPFQGPLVEGEGECAFVSKMIPTSSSLAYSSYLCPTLPTVIGVPVTLGARGLSIAVDSAGNAYVTGSTVASTFPTTPGAFQTTFGGGTCGTGPNASACADAFVVKLNPTGSGLVYSTYLGGSGDDLGLGIAVDSSGNAYVTGSTASANFPTANPLQAVFGGGTCGTAPNTFPCADAFVVKLNPAGSALVYSTYLGGSGEDRGNGIAVDSAGNVYVAGRTASANFPTAGPLQAVLSGPGDAFVAKVNPTGSTLVYSTYLGGSGDDSGNGIAVDSSGNTYVTGQTFSQDFPTTPGAFQTANGNKGGPDDDSNDAFVVKLNPAGSVLVYSTYLGGRFGDGGSGVAVDPAGNAYVTGFTGSTDFPTANPLQGSLGGGLDAFVAKMNPTGSALVYSTYLGGSGEEFGAGIAVDNSGNAYVTGSTASPNFPTANPFQAALASGTCDDSPCSDVFVAKISPLVAPSVALGPSSLTFADQALDTASLAQTVRLLNAGSASLTIASITISGDFSQTSNCPPSGNALAAGTGCDIGITFTPRTTGTGTGALTVTDNAAGSPHTVSLTGSGVASTPDFSISTASGSSNSATVAAGQAATYRLSMVASNGFNGTVSLTCNSPAPASTCSVSPNSVALSGTNPATATVGVTTTTRSLVPPGLRPPTLSPGLGLRVALPWLLLMLSLMLLASSLRRHPNLRRRAWAGLGAVVVLAMLSFGCGGSSSSPPPPAQQGTSAGSYSITVTANSGSLTHSMTLNLMVQ